MYEITVWDVFYMQGSNTTEEILDSYQVNYLWFKIYQAYKKIYKHITKQLLHIKVATYILCSRDSNLLH